MILMRRSISFSRKIHDGRRELSLSNLIHWKMFWKIEIVHKGEQPRAR